MMRLSTAYGISALAHVALLAAVQFFVPQDLGVRPVPMSGGGLSIEFLPHGIPGTLEAAVAFESPQTLPVVEEVAAEPAPAEVTAEPIDVRSRAVRNEVPPPVAAEPAAVSIETPTVFPATAPTQSEVAEARAPKVAATSAALPSRRIARQGPAAASHAVPTEIARTRSQEGHGGGGGAVGGQVDSLPLKGPYNLPPDYPIDALLARVQGRVVLRAEVGSDGLVEALAVRRSSGWHSLDEAALQAVRRWRFVPARRGGIAVACEVLVPVRFSIPQQ